jgi:hypothetical protein
MRRILYTPDGYFVAAHLEAANVPNGYLFVDVEDAAAENLSTRHRYNGASWELAGSPSEHMRESQWAIVRTTRDSFLAASDWTQIQDASASDRSAWVIYRQALRDITDQPNPFALAWPEPPGQTGQQIINQPA